MNIYQDRNIESAMDALDRALKALALEPGERLYAIRGTCYKCPEGDDYCRVDCRKKDKKHVDKTEITEVCVKLREDDGFSIEFKDTDGNIYQGSDIGKVIFVDREEALAQL